MEGVAPQTAGLIMLPLLGFGVVATQVAVRLIARFSYRVPIVSGYLFLIAGSLLLAFVQHSTPLAVILLALSILGISNGLTNMGLQSALYAHAGPQQTGMASGLFLTFRSLGSIFSTA
ncbi:MFS transporter [Paenibacillus sp. P26]|nr:MFS transporter [Paenibacillus sp. P26]UUZ95125.1 MFS transporter [Paenibacillus sp. P25]